MDKAKFEGNPLTNHFSQGLHRSYANLNFKCFIAFSDKNIRN